MKKAVIVCTDKKGVVFGYVKKPKVKKDGTIKLKNARMCLYWPQEVGGVFGLGENGPDSNTRISAELKGITLYGITAIFDVSKKAEKTWKAAPVQGRE